MLVLAALQWPAEQAVCLAQEGMPEVVECPVCLGPRLWHGGRGLQSTLCQGLLSSTSPWHPGLLRALCCCCHWGQGNDKKTHLQQHNNMRFVPVHVIH